MINIDDFDSFLINIIKAILNNDDFNSLLGETNTLMAEYIDLIVCLKEIEPFFPMDHNRYTYSLLKLSGLLYRVHILPVILTKSKILYSTLMMRKKEKFSHGFEIKNDTPHIIGY